MLKRAVAKTLLPQERCKATARYIKFLELSTDRLPDFLSSTDCGGRRAESWLMNLYVVN